VSNYPQPSGRGATGLVIGAIAAGAVLAVLAVTTVFLLVRKGEDEPAPEGAARSFPMAGQIAWTAEPATSEPKDANRQAWQTDDLVVYLDVRSGQFRALDPATGRPRWGYEVPTDLPAGTSTDIVCAASKNARDGAVAVVYARAFEGSYRCSGLMLLDLTTGEPRWDKPQPGLFDARSVDIGAGVVTTVVFPGAVAFDTATGARRWSMDTEKIPGDCAPRQISAGAKALALWVECAGERQQIWTLAPRTGRPTARAPIPGERLAFVGLEPVTVLTDHSDVQVLSADGRRVEHSFGVSHPAGYASLPDAPPAVVRWKSTLVALGPRGSVDAWDLRSGEQLWSRQPRLPGEEGLLADGFPHIAAVDDKGVVCVLSGIPNKAAVARLDLGTGAQADLSRSFETEEFDMIDELWWFWDGRRAVGVRDHNPTTIENTKAIAFAIG
jgi:hypothetical protein